MPAAGDDQDLDFSPIIGWQSGRIFRWHGVFGFADAMVKQCMCARVCMSIDVVCIPIMMNQ